MRFTDKKPHRLLEQRWLWLGVDSVGTNPRKREAHRETMTHSKNRRKNDRYKQSTPRTTNRKTDPKRRLLEKNLQKYSTIGM